MMSFALVTIVKATLVCGAAFLVTRLCRRARASIRHLLFALAFVAFVVIPVAGPVLPAVTMTSPAAMTVPLLETFPAARPSASADPSTSGVPSRVPETASPAPVTIAQVVAVVWLTGVALFLIPLVIGLSQIRRLRERALPWTGGQELTQTLAAALGVRQRVETLLHGEVTGPITFGVVRPTILLPVSALEWDQASLRRALGHELEHVARCDFLTLCLSRVVCAVYWFHPLVWAAWSRMRLEAERACDDAVADGDDARDYASFLVSMAALEPAGQRRPVLAMAGRKDLATRIAALLDARQRRGRVGPRRAAALIAVAAIAMLVAAPITVARAIPQAQPPAPTAGAAASIKREALQAQITWRDGRLVASGATLQRLLIMAYGVRDVVEAPPWVRFDRFDITVDLPSDFKLPEQGSKNLQAFLTERFKLTAHTGTREFPIYAMVLARRDGSLGPRITRSQVECSPASPCGLSTTHGRTTGRGVTMAAVANHLLVGNRNSGQVVDREIVDRTGLDGRFDFTVEWTPDTASQTAQFRPYPSLLEANAPNLLQAFEEQLGLRVESQLAPKPVLIIDSIEPPAEK